MPEVYGGPTAADVRAAYKPPGFFNPSNPIVFIALLTPSEVLDLVRKMMEAIGRPVE